MRPPPEKANAPGANRGASKGSLLAGKRIGDDLSRVEWRPQGLADPRFNWLTAADQLQRAELACHRGAWR